MTFVNDEKGYVAIYVPSLRGGGAERIMVIVANALASRMFKVDLVCANAVGPYVNHVSEGVRVVNLRATRVSTSLPGLIKYIRRERPDAILSALGHANVIAVLANKLAGSIARVVVSQRSIFSLSSRNEVSIRGKSIGLFLRWAYRRADGIVAISKGVADDLANSLGLPRSSISVVYNPVAIQSVCELSECSVSYPWLQASARPILLGVGRLVNEKDFFCLLKAFSILRQSREACLVILGEGALLGELERTSRELGVEECVYFPGFVDNPFAVMRRADLFVMSSKWEGFGNVLVEAMACGTPVISTECPSGPPEILEGGKWGRLVPVGDVKMLADAMIKALDDNNPPDVRKRASEFSVDRAVDGYLRLLFPDRNFGERA